MLPSHSYPLRNNVKGHSLGGLTPQITSNSPVADNESIARAEGKTNCLRIIVKATSRIAQKGNLTLPNRFA